MQRLGIYHLESSLWLYFKRLYIYHFEFSFLCFMNQNEKKSVKERKIKKIMRQKIQIIRFKTPYILKALTIEWI